MKRLPLLFLLLAWACAQGVHLEVLQVAAWARMVAQESRAVPFAEALRAVFAEDASCEWCDGIGRAREATPKRADTGDRADDPSERSLRKLLFCVVEAVPGSRPARIVAFPDEVEPLWDSRADAVPVPPPRAPVRHC